MKKLLICILILFSINCFSQTDTVKIDSSLIDTSYILQRMLDNHFKKNVEKIKKQNKSKKPIEVIPGLAAKRRLRIKN